MDRPTALGARLRDLQARSAATDQAAAVALADLQTSGMALATAMDRLAEALEAAAES